MAPVIPMNAKTTKFTDLGRYYLLYTCPYCGAAGLSEQQLRKEEERHFLKLGVHVQSGAGQGFP